MAESKIVTACAVAVRGNSPESKAVEMELRLVALNAAANGEDPELTRLKMREAQRAARS